jgi:hypothetical protein
MSGETDPGDVVQRHQLGRVGVDAFGSGKADYRK